MVITALIASTWIGQAQGWTLPKSLIVDGFEKLGPGREMPYRLQTSQGRVVFATQRGILSWSTGLTRLESNTGKGFFTWMEGSSRALKLVGPTHPDILTWLQPVRFSRAAVQSGAVSGWKQEAVESVVRRPCWMLKSDGTPNQRLWVDQSSGITLKQEDFTSSGSLRYVRTVTSFQADASLHEELFSPVSGALVLSGIPHPSILLRTPLANSPDVYAKDLATIKGKSKLGADLWLKKIAPPAGFEYSGTQSEELAGKVVKEVWPKNQMGGIELEPGIPAGWGANVKIGEDPKTI